MCITHALPNIDCDVLNCSAQPYWLMHGMHPNPARVNSGASPTPTSYCSGDEDGDFEDYNGDERILFVWLFGLVLSNLCLQELKKKKQLT